MKWKLSPRTVSLLIVAATFIAVLLTQRLGLLQFLEFRAYDFFIRRQPLLASGDPIVLVEMTEEDIHSPSLDYPITDEKLAELLNKLEIDQPAVIGLDIWRDIPVPKSGLHTNEFNDALLTHTNIIGIYTLGLNKAGIAPPPALAPYPDQLGFNDNFQVDDSVEKTTPKVRRSYLYSKEESGRRLDAFPFRIACSYLEQRGMKPAFDSDELDKVQFLTIGKGQLRVLQPNDGPYVRADTSGGQILLDFKHPKDFSRYSVSEALAGKIPKDGLRGKIVIIGMNTPSVSDDQATPISYHHLGIERQSLTILQLLRTALEGEKPLRFWPGWAKDTWMFGWCVLGGAIGYGIRSPWRFIAAIGFGLLALGVIAGQSFEAGWWIPLMYPAASFLPAASLVTSYISFQEHRNRNQLMQLFSNQVSPDIAKALWDQREAFLAGNRPLSQKLIATILFTDLKGFSETSEALAPAALMDWLNEYMEVMANAVMAHEGVVEKYIGDSIMAVFGVPIPRASQEQIARDALNAVSCANVMRKEMEKLNVLWQDRGLPACGMRIGIHTGPLVAGSLGSLDRQEYTVIGDSVNIASRLEGFDKDSTNPHLSDDKCRILISEATRALLDQEFKFHAVGTMSLKGKSDKVMIYAVLGQSDSEGKT